MAISYEPELLLARDQGLKLVVDRRARAAPADLDHRAARPARQRASPTSRASASAPPGIPYQAASCTRRSNTRARTRRAAKEVNVGFNLVPAMLSGKVDATLGGFWNYEAIQLRLLHRHPLVIPVDQAGVPTYNELVLVVREDEARSADRTCARSCRR